MKGMNTISRYRILSKVFLNGKILFSYKTVYAFTEAGALQKHYDYTIEKYCYTKVVSIKRERVPIENKFLNSLVFTQIATVLGIVVYASIMR